MTEQNKQELSTGKILSLERRSNMTDDEALRFARAVESLVNKQPPAEAGEGAVYQMEFTPGGWKDVNEAAYERLHGVYQRRILYTSQTTATQAAVAAAMMKCADICDSLHGELEEIGGLNKLHVIRSIKSSILTVIPAEANAALRELLKDTIRAARQYDYASNNWIHTGSLEDIVDRILAEKGGKAV